MTEQTTPATETTAGKRPTCHDCRAIWWNAITQDGLVISKASCLLTHQRVNPQTIACVYFQPELLCLRHADRS